MEKKYFEKLDITTLPKNTQRGTRRNPQSFKSKSKKIQPDLTDNLAGI
ncbi:MAG: hypothetical protein H0X29_04400 [Parachlamydiaceae bacterium]|nr:hypothetical protein [Parachlamydiaceae bacterium]